MKPFVKKLEKTLYCLADIGEEMDIGNQHIDWYLMNCDVSRQQIELEAKQSGTRVVKLKLTLEEDNEKI